MAEKFITASKHKIDEAEVICWDNDSSFIPQQISMGGYQVISFFVK